MQRVANQCSGRVSVDLEISNPVEEAHQVVVELGFGLVRYLLAIRSDSLAIAKPLFDALEGTQDVAEVAS